MQEIKGNIFALMQEERFNAFCITTNGFVKKNGACVMGKGIAQVARDKFPNLDMDIGARIKESGNHVFKMGKYKDGRIITFPVKHNWWENADIDLIIQSCHELERLIDHEQYEAVLLPRPGCGNGNLNWNDVKKIIEPILSDRVFVATF